MKECIKVRNQVTMVLSFDDRRKLATFVTILINIDRRTKITKRRVKRSKTKSSNIRARDLQRAFL